MIWDIVVLEDCCLSDIWVKQASCILAGNSCAWAYSKPTDSGISMSISGNFIHFFGPLEKLIKKLGEREKAL